MASSHGLGGEPREQSTWPGGPAEAAAPGHEGHRGTARPVGHVVASEYQKDTVGVGHRTLEAEPCGRGQPSELSVVMRRKVEEDDLEEAGLDETGRRGRRSGETVRFAPTWPPDPEEAIEVDPSRLGRSGVETVGRVHECPEAATGRDVCEEAHGDTGTS